MATSKLIIRDYKGCRNKDGTSLIFLQYSHGYHTTLLSTGEKVAIKYWGTSRQEVRKSFKGFSTINMVIQKFKTRVDDIARRIKLDGGEPSVSAVKDILKGKEEKPKQVVPTLVEFVEQWIEEQIPLKRPLTIRSYKTSLRQLKEYSEYIGKSISYANVDLQFYDGFLSFLYKSRNLSFNSAGSHIKNLKVWLGVALERDYHQNLAFKNKRFRVISEPSDNIYLNELQLEQIYSHDFSYDKRLERVRDLFLIGCFTGLRFSDLSRLTAANIQNGYLVVNTRKTDERVVIPLHSYVKSITSRYLLETGEPFPKAFKGEQKFNVHIKSVAQIVGLNQIVKIRVSRGGKVYSEEYKISELISSHCCRRSFCTNMYKQGIPTIVLMRISGHRTERAFMRYIKLNQENSAEILKQHWDKLSSASPAPTNKISVTESINLN